MTTETINVVQDALPTEEQQAEAELKHLGFVTSSTAYAYDISMQLYRYLRNYTPTSIEPSLEKVELHAHSVSAPYVSRAQERATELLRSADSRVEDMLTGAARQQDRPELQQVKKAFNTYLEFITSTSEFVANSIRSQSEVLQASTVQAVSQAQETLTAAVNKAREAGAVPTAATLKFTHDAWTAFVTMPAVVSVLEAAGPARQRSLEACNELHDSLVANQTYKAAFKKGEEALSYAATTTPYKMGAQYIYPQVAPLAERVSNSKRVQDTIAYWTPAKEPEAALEVLTEATVEAH